MMFVFRALTSRYHGESDQISKRSVLSKYGHFWLCHGLGLLLFRVLCHVLLPDFVFFPTCLFLVPAFAPQIYSVFLLLFSVAFWFVFWYFTLVVSWILVSLFVTCPPFAFLEHI